MRVAPTEFGEGVYFGSGQDRENDDVSPDRC